MKLKLIINSKTMPKRFAGVSLKTGKPYDFISCWGETLDEQRLGHRVNLDPVEWDAFVADGLRERDGLIVETSGEGKPRTDANGKSVTRKSASGVDYVVMEFSAVAFDGIPGQRLRGMPLKASADLPKGVQDAPNLLVIPTPAAPKAPETPEEAIQNDGTPKAPEEPKAPETAMTDAGSVSPM